MTAAVQQHRAGAHPGAVRPKTQPGRGGDWLAGSLSPCSGPERRRRCSTRGLLDRLNAPINVYSIDPGVGAFAFFSVRASIVAAQPRKKIGSRRPAAGDFSIERVGMASRQGDSSRCRCKRAQAKRAADMAACAPSSPHSPSPSAPTARHPATHVCPQPPLVCRLCQNAAAGEALLQRCLARRPPLRPRAYEVVCQSAGLGGRAGRPPTALARKSCVCRGPMSPPSRWTAPLPS